jgi:alpha-L-rhamnosidase
MPVKNPFPHYPKNAGFTQKGIWPARWVVCPGAEQPPAVAAYRLRLRLNDAQVVRLYVTADERYELFCDGVRLARGPERGEPRHWLYDTLDLDLSPGEHVLVARAWALGELAPTAQFHLCTGLLVCPVEERFWDIFATGRAPWEAKPLPGYRFTSPMGSAFVGYKIALDGRQFPWDFETGAGDGWMPVKVLDEGVTAGIRTDVTANAHFLAPGTLPPQMDEARQVGQARHISAPSLSETHAIPLRAGDHLAEEVPAWMNLLRGEEALTLPPHTRRRVIIDLEDYYCAYPELVVSGGEDATLRLHWQESLFQDLETWDKGHRGEVEGKYFTMMWYHRDGLGDSYRLDGGLHRRLDTLWWHAGRYVELLVETSNQPLTIESLVWRETRYPLEAESRFQADDARLEKVIPIAVRALQMCAHETYMDCPYST